MGYPNLILMVFILVLVVSQNGHCKADHHDCHKKVDNGGVGFVQRNGTRFILNGKPYYLNGFNAYWLMYVASDPSARSKITSTFQQASQYGLNIARTFAFNDGGYRALQISPGSYDESVFRGLDFVISEAEKYGMRLILSLVNSWTDYGGKHRYVQWARERGLHVNSDDDFFTLPVVKQYYKNHVKVMLTRKNTITGKVYKDDQAIFAWELMNEPRFQNDFSGKSFQVWVSEMAAYVKSIDSNHLLEIGLEGFYGESMPKRKQFNPGFQIGTDFISNNQVPQIDFATFHLYPDQWLPSSNETVQNAFADRWIQIHIKDSSDILGKPILLGEFGKSSRSYEYSVGKRDSYFGKLYNVIYSSASSGGPCAGGLFWQLMTQGMDKFSDGYEIILEESPSTANVITQQSKKMSNLK